jgi:hypothetical protein
MSPARRLAANGDGEYPYQYALAPIIIVRGTDQEWNVANLSQEAVDLWTSRDGGGFEIRPLGSGLYLLSRNRN